MDYSRSNAALLRRQAQAEGKHLYWTGKNCRNGHDAGRYTATGQCSVCASERANRCAKAKRHGANGDEVRAKANAYRAEWKKRPEVQEMLLRKGKEWSVAYRKRWPIKPRVDTANYKAIRLGIEGRLKVTEIEELLAKQNFICATCEVALPPDYHIDHKVPFSSQGPNTIDNIQILCPPCNCHKHCTDPDEWDRRNGKK